MAEDDVIRPSDLMYYGGSVPAEESAGEGRLAEMEKREIARTLREFGGHRSKAAESLGINRKTLREKIRRYGIED